MVDIFKVVCFNKLLACHERLDTTNMSPSTGLGTFDYSGNSTAVVEWRRGRDLNPGAGKTRPRRLAISPLQPLGYLSV